MKKIILDGKKITSKELFHKEIKEKLELPDYYGENLDALWDCINGWIEESIYLKWINFNESEKNLGNYANKIIELFKDAESEIEGFTFEIIE